MVDLPRCPSLCFALCVLTLLMAGGSSTAQQSAPPQQAETPAEPPATNLLDGLGKLFSPSRPQPDPATPAPVTNATEPPAPPATPPAATAPPSSRFFPGMAGGREACLPSANGAPDCQAAADKLCQAKGYKSGKSLNTDSAYGCSARRAPSPKPCGTEYYVTSAFCQ